MLLKGALKAMLIAIHKFAVAVMLTAGLVLGATGLSFHQARADKLEAKAVDPLSAEQFAKTLALIKPQPGESKWTEIPWLLSVHDARVKAAAVRWAVRLPSGSRCPLVTEGDDGCRW